MRDRIFDSGDGDSLRSPLVTFFPFCYVRFVTNCRRIANPTERKIRRNVNVHSFLTFNF